MENEYFEPTEILRIERDVEGLLVVNIKDEVAWHLSTPVRQALVTELRNHVVRTSKATKTAPSNIEESYNTIINEALDGLMQK